MINKIELELFDELNDFFQQFVKELNKTSASFHSHFQFSGNPNHNYFLITREIDAVDRRLEKTVFKFALEYEQQRNAFTINYEIKLEGYYGKNSPCGNFEIKKGYSINDLDNAKSRIKKIIMDELRIENKIIAEEIAWTENFDIDFPKMLEEITVNINGYCSKKDIPLFVYARFAVNGFRIYNKKYLFEFRKFSKPWCIEVNFGGILQPIKHRLIEVSENQTYTKKDITRARQELFTFMMGYIEKFD